MSFLMDRDEGFEANELFCVLVFVFLFLLLIHTWKP